MNFRTTVILLVLLVGALVFYIVANRSENPDEPDKPVVKEDNDKGRLLLTVKAADVRKLVIRPGEGAPAGAKLLELSQASGKWTIAQPINWPADSFDAQNLVDAVVNVRSGGSIDLTPDKSASTGLAKPRYRIEVTDAAGKVHKLTVGDRSSLGYLYVQANDETTGSVVSGGPLADRLAKKTDQLVTGLRDKQILRVSSFDVKQVRVKQGGASGTVIALEKPAPGLVKPGFDAGGEWRMTAPVAEPVETSEASDLISTLTNLRAEEFSDEASATSVGATFDRPQAVITLSASAPATQPATAPAAPATNPAGTDLPGGVTITIGQAVDVDGEKCWVKVSDPPTIAKVSLNKAAIEKFTKATPLSLRDRKVFAAEPAQVSEVTIKSSSATQPSEQKTVRLVRRHDSTELGPFLPKGSRPGTEPSTQPATQPAGGGAAAPATQPAASPTTKPASESGSGDAVPPVPSPGSAMVPAVVSPAESVAHHSDAESPNANRAGSPDALAIGMASYGSADEGTGGTAHAARLAASTRAASLLAAVMFLNADAAAPATQPATPTTQPAAGGDTAATPPTTQPSATTAPTTTPATGPTTGPAVAAAATQPIIPPEPPKPPTQWIVASKDDADANDDSVTQFLSDLNPLRAVKYLEKPPEPSTQPATQPVPVTYVLTIKTVAAGGGAKTIEIRITDPGAGAKPYGQYQDLYFEVDAAIVQKLQSDFTQPPAEPAMPRGGPPGGFPGGFPGGMPPGMPPMR